MAQVQAHMISVSKPKQAVKLKSVLDNVKISVKMKRLDQEPMNTINNWAKESLFQGLKADKI